MRLVRQRWQARRTFFGADGRVDIDAASLMNGFLEAKSVGCVWFLTRAARPGLRKRLPVHLLVQKQSWSSRRQMGWVDVGEENDDDDD
jgi:hypothetical protein